MKRLTTDTPSGNFETMLNFVYGKDGWAYIRHDGEHENVRLTAWAKRQCKLHGCDEVWTETPEEIDQRLCDCMMEGPICPIAMAYCFASQAVHLRSRLSSYEDTGLQPEEITAEPYGCVFYCNRKCNLDGDFCAEGPGCPHEIGAEAAKHLLELAQAEKDGRLAVLPIPVGAGKAAYGLTDSDDGQQHIVTIECDYLEKLEIWDNPGHEVVIEADGWEIGKSDIGKTVFLIREEAEAALKKRGGRQ